MFSTLLCFTSLDWTELYLQVWTVNWKVWSVSEECGEKSVVINNLYPALLSSTLLTSSTLLSNTHVHSLTLTNTHKHSFSSSSSSSSLYIAEFVAWMSGLNVSVLLFIRKYIITCILRETYLFNLIVSQTALIEEQRNTIVWSIYLLLDGIKFFSPALQVGGSLPTSYPLAAISTSKWRQLVAYFTLESLHIKPKKGHLSKASGNTLFKSLLYYILSNMI